MKSKAITLLLLFVMLVSVVPAVSAQHSPSDVVKPRWGIRAGLGLQALSGLTLPNSFGMHLGGTVRYTAMYTKQVGLDLMGTLQLSRKGGNNDLWGGDHSFYYVDFVLQSNFVFAFSEKVGIHIGAGLAPSVALFGSYENGGVSVSQGLGDGFNRFDVALTTLSGIRLFNKYDISIYTASGMVDVLKYKIGNTDYGSEHLGFGLTFVYYM